MWDLPLCLALSPPLSLALSFGVREFNYFANFDRLSLTTFRFIIISQYTLCFADVICCLLIMHIRGWSETVFSSSVFHTFSYYFNTNSVNWMNAITSRTCLVTLVIVVEFHSSKKILFRALYTPREHNQSVTILNELQCRWNWILYWIVLVFPFVAYICISFEMSHLLRFAKWFWPQNVIFFLII